MKETTRRIVFLLLVALVLYHMGAHISQAFVNYPAWGFISMESFPQYHLVMKYGAGRFLLLPRGVELVLAIAVLCFPPAIIKRWMIVLCISLALCALLSTVFIQKPIHDKLEIIGNTPDLLSRLRTTGWLRLIPESLRTGLYLWMLSVLVRQGAGAANNDTHRVTAA